MKSAKQVARECGTKVRYPTFEAAMVGHTPGVRRSGR